LLYGCGTWSLTLRSERNKYLPVQYNRTKFLFSVYYELTASTCFKHYLPIIRRHCIHNNWYIACVLCQLAATRVGVELQPWQQPADCTIRNKPKTKSASCWSYYTDILRCTVNKTLSLPMCSCKGSSNFIAKKLYPGRKILTGYFSPLAPPPSTDTDGGRYLGAMGNQNSIND
jgi:hypothetical protein